MEMYLLTTPRGSRENECRSPYQLSGPWKRWGRFFLVSGQEGPLSRKLKKRSRKRKKNAPAWRPETKKKRCRRPPQNAGLEAGSEGKTLPETKQKRPGLTKQIHSRKREKMPRIGGRKPRENMAGNEKKSFGPARRTGPEKGSGKRGPQNHVFRLLHAECCRIRWFPSQTDRK